MDETKMRFSEYLLKKIKEEQIERQNIQRSGRRERVPNIFAIDKQLNLYFAFEQLKNYCTYLNHKNTVSSRLINEHIEAFEMMTAVITFVDKQIDLPILIKIYRQIVDLYQSLNKEKKQSKDGLLILSTVENLIEIEEINNADLIEVYSNLTNYCTYQINHGHNDFLIKNLIYNQRLLELEFNQHGLINSGAYKNFVTLILKTLDECSPQQIQKHLPIQHENLLKWASNFIEKYKNRLEEIDREKYYQYSKALISFYKKEYLEAFDALKQLARIRELFVSLDVKMLQLQVYLELDIQLDETFEESGIDIKKTLDSFRNQIAEEKRNPKMNYHLNYYEDFYKIYTRFYVFFIRHAWEEKGGTSYNNKLRRLKALIDSAQYSYKKWFIEKLEDIK